MTEPDTQSAPEEGWHPADIKAAIAKRGMTLTLLATRNRLQESACRVSLNRGHPEGDRVISEYLGVSLHELWPTRYDADGLPIHHVRDEVSRERDRSHRLSSVGG